MGLFNWTARNKRTGAVGKRESRNGDINDVETMQAHLEAGFPYVEVSDLTMVDEPADEPGATGGPRVVRVAVPTEDFEHGHKEAIVAAVQGREPRFRTPEETPVTATQPGTPVTVTDVKPVKK